MREIKQLCTVKPIKEGDHVNIISLSEDREYIGTVRKVLLQFLINEDNWINHVEVEEE